MLIAAKAEEVLPRTKALTWEGALDERMIEGAHRFVERKLEVTTDGADGMVEERRERLRFLLGAGNRSRSREGAGKRRRGGRGSEWERGAIEGWLALAMGSRRATKSSLSMPIDRLPWACLEADAESASVWDSKEVGDK